MVCTYCHCYYEPHKVKKKTLLQISKPFIHPVSTSGGTLEASFWRIVGTLVGAFTGWAALAAGENSPYLLGAFAVLLGMYILHSCFSVANVLYNSYSILLHPFGKYL